MKFLRRIFRLLIAIILIALVSFIIVKVFLGEPKPSGEGGVRAERLADRMLEVLNYEAYQELEEIRWTFARGNHHYVWRKKVDSVEVSWDDHRVLMNTNTLEGSAFMSGTELSGSAARELLETAWKYFANDSFWLVAPFKVKDPGTQLELVTTDIGHGLLVTYTSGGVTPGDSYLWILDNKDRPIAWQMWVSIIPIGGLELTWEGWESYEGVWFATRHESAIPLSVNITNLEVK
mgnify:CR=1 FL=1